VSALEKQSVSSGHGVRPLPEAKAALAKFTNFDESWRTSGPQLASLSSIA
jgi:hypothetical protein